MFSNRGDDRVVITSPAYQTEKILRGSCSNENHEKLLEILSKVQYTPIATCTVIVERSKCPRLESGFGCLVPRNEGLTILGVLFNSSIFENRVSHDDQFASLTCIIQDNHAEITDQQLEKLVSKELSMLFMNENDSIPILNSSLKRWGCGIPVYNHYLYKSWINIHNMLSHHLPNVNLFGNFTGQISIRGMIGQVVNVLNKVEHASKKE